MTSANAAILHVPDCQEPHQVERALAYLINREVIREFSNNQVTFYYLTETEPLRGQLLNLARFEWSRQNFIHRRGEVYA